MWMKNAEILGSSPKYRGQINMLFAKDCIYDFHVHFFFLILKFKVQDL